MSNRTLVEFNHDVGFKIEEKPELFVALLGDMIRGGPSARLREEMDALFGVRIVEMRHHSDECKVVYKWHTVEL